jgi:hypothetical protein
MHRAVAFALTLACLAACSSPAASSAHADASTDGVATQDSSGSDALADVGGDVTSTQDAGSDAGDVTAPQDATPTDTAGDAEATVDASLDGDSGPLDTGPAACTGGKDCTGGLVCVVSACGQPGKCQPAPVPCASEPAWECGCDGKDYQNACERIAQGIGLFSTGKCKPAGQPCDAKVQGSCAAGQYCVLKEGCDAKALGACAAIPAQCTGNPDGKVCACDGQEFASACEAAQAGVNVAHAGSCEASGKMCGGIAGFQCAKGMICDRMECYPDAAGQCAWLAASCPVAPAGQEECGCNGKTYGSVCERQLAGVGRKNAGVCTTP